MIFVVEVVVKGVLIVGDVLVDVKLVEVIVVVCCWLLWLFEV